jgi:O-antigen/teichoic acid export membrane protein
MALAVGSLRRDAVTRFGADGVALCMGFVTGVITARELGPAGKGTLAVLAFLSGLFAQLTTLGLGDVVIVWFGRRRLPLQEAFSRILPPVLGSALIGAASVAAIGLATLDGGGELHAAIATTAAATALACMGLILGSALIAASRFTVASAALALGATTTAALTFVLLVVIDLGLLGATLALAFGALAGVVLSITGMRRANLRFAARTDGTFLREAIPYGARVLSGGILAVLAGRLDVYLVYLLDRGAAAGQYSVALTLAGVTGIAVVSLTYVAFPRLASLDDAASLDLTARTARQALVLSIAVAVPLAAAAPILVPFVFGSDFEGAVVPALILFVGYVLSSLQWVLTRSFAARAQPKIVARSWAATAGLMVVLDLGLIPALGPAGAAVGWGLATAVGVGICLRRHFRDAGPQAMEHFVPRVADLLEGVRLVRALVLGWR